MTGRTVPLLIASILGLACAPAPEPASRESAGHPWLGNIQTPLPTFDYPLLAASDRSERIDLVADLVIGERPGTLDFSFGEEAPTVAVDEHGRLFVYDPGNYRVAVFSSEGDFLYAFGSRGQGPGEFSNDRRGQIGFSDGLLFIFTSYRQVAFWQPNGEFVDGSSHRVDELRLVPLYDGTFLSADYLRGEIARPVAGGGEMGTSILLARYRLENDGLAEQQRYAIVPTGLRPQFAGRFDGHAYVSAVNADVTEVVAFEPGGQPQWSARFHWPEEQMVMATDLLIDGRGRIYVYPRENRIERPATPQPRRLDVLSPAGEHLAAALVDEFRGTLLWQQARDDYVFGVRTNTDTFEWEVVRYRLALRTE